MKNIAQDIFNDIQTIRAKGTLVHNITNLVVMQQTANALLALGASPLMAHAPEELADIVNLSHALVLNIGTLDANWISSMKQAAVYAGKRQLPIVLDPVGAGASQLRTQSALAILETSYISLIRANAAEIIALTGKQIDSKGVDSQYASEMACASAQELCQQFGCVVVISGQVDYIVTPTEICRLHNGVAMMTKVTGMGCTASAICGALLAVNPNAAAAAMHAMAIMGIAGEIALQKSPAPGSFAVSFLDALYQLNYAHIEALLKYETI